MKQRHRICAVLLTWATSVAGAGSALAARGEAPAVDVPAVVADALQTALSDVLPEARLDVVGWKVPGNGRCTPTGATLDRAINGSGRYAIKMEGGGCGAWAWATVKVYAPAFITTRTVRMGEALDGAVKAVDQEVHAGRTPAPVTPGSKAARALNNGQLVEANHIEAGGPKPGSPIKVIVQSGSLSVTQYGRAISCGRGHICAVLPSGKRVEGDLDGDVLQVVMQ
jgi:hypothetical protein